MSRLPEPGPVGEAQPTRNQELTSYERACPLDDLWQGEAFNFKIQGQDVLLVHTESGGIHAIQGQCPHQAVLLEGGALEGDFFTCPMHLWQFNVVTGKGVNPSHAEVARYAVKVVDGDVWVSCTGIHPKHCRP